MTRPTDHSLPGIGWALITTTSFSRSLKTPVLAGGQLGQGRHGLSLGAGRDHAHLARLELIDVLDVDHGTVGDVQEPEFPGQGHVLLHRAAQGGHLPPPGDGGIGHLLDPVDVAGEAGHDEPSVRPGQEDPPQRLAHRRLRGGEPGLLGVGGVESSSRIPGSEARAPMRARSVRRPSTGWRSILKSPEWRMIPCGVWKAVAKACGTEWVTGMNSTSTGSDAPALPVPDRDELDPLVHAGLVDPVSGQSQGQLGPVDRHREVPEQVGQAAGVVLVPVGQDDPVDAVGVLSQVGEVGEDQVHPRHVRVGEHDAHVEDEDAPVDLDAGAVPADLAETPEEDDPHRGAPGPAALASAPAAGRRLRRRPRRSGGGVCRGSGTLLGWGIGLGRRLLLPGTGRLPGPAALLGVRVLGAGALGAAACSLIVH